MIRTMAWIIGFYYICKFGDDVTHRFQDIFNSIYECPWYEMPINIKKHFPMMMAFSQKPIHIYGCLNIRCTRVTFRKVSNTKIIIPFKVDSFLFVLFHSSCLYILDYLCGIFLFHGFARDCLKLFSLLLLGGSR